MDQKDKNKKDYTNIPIKSEQNNNDVIIIIIYSLIFLFSNIY